MDFKPFIPYALFNFALVLTNAGIGIFASCTPGNRLEWILSIGGVFYILTHALHLFSTIGFSREFNVPAEIQIIEAVSLIAWYFRLSYCIEWDQTKRNFKARLH